MPVPERDGLNIVSLEVHDVRFPTSLGGHGSDALVRRLSKRNNYINRSLKCKIPYLFNLSYNLRKQKQNSDAIFNPKP